MPRFLIILVLLLSFIKVRAEEANPLQNINLGELQKHLEPILQNIDTKKIIQSMQQVPNNASTEKGEILIPDTEPEEGDLCDINDPEHCKEKTMKYEDLKPKQKELLDAAEKAMANSYSPYSHFMVGAAVLTEDGTIIPGTNYENAAYGSSICAERVAIMAANARGYRKLKKIAIIGKGETDAPLVSPCGSCRQVINESSDLSTHEIEVIMSNTQKTKIVIKGIKELLPLSFGPGNLS